MKFPTFTCSGSSIQHTFSPIKWYTICIHIGSSMVFPVLLDMRLNNSLWIISQVSHQNLHRMHYKLSTCLILYNNIHWDNCAEINVQIIKQQRHLRRDDRSPDIDTKRWHRIQALQDDKRLGIRLNRTLRIWKCSELLRGEPIRTVELPYIKTVVEIFAQLWSIARVARTLKERGEWTYSASYPFTDSAHCEWPYTISSACFRWRTSPRAGKIVCPFERENCSPIAVRLVEMFSKYAISSVRLQQTHIHVLERIFVHNASATVDIAIDWRRSIQQLVGGS